MSEVHKNLFVGGAELCSFDEGETILHACKSPCHQWVVGYKGSLPQSHDEYLVARRGSHLVLNLIDPPVPLFRRESFDAALDYLDEVMPAGPVKIHCNGGASRAPMLALLYLAKRLKAIPGGSFHAAQEAFTTLYPTFAPGQGIATYLMSNWQALK